eukprot:snap_masked-scaffold_7-processed-gene-13.44-mRNA-1 protein AED:1.00 eAED:1.00 QI:0/0/0/0/1/1/2/0/73
MSGVVALRFLKISIAQHDNRTQDADTNRFNFVITTQTITEKTHFSCFKIIFKNICLVRSLTRTCQDILPISNL